MALASTTMVIQVQKINPEPYRNPWCLLSSRRCCHVQCNLRVTNQMIRMQRVLGEDVSVKGEVFGWIMAAIYMGGRLPQIWLNVCTPSLLYPDSAQ
jgi:hypothetical protein